MATNAQNILDLFGEPSTISQGDNQLAQAVNGVAGNFVGINTSNPGAGVTAASGGILPSLGGFLGDTFKTASSLLDPLSAFGGTGAAAAGAASGALDRVSALFLRGVVIITGFIFVAVGLSMFKNTSIVVQAAVSPVKHIRKGLGV